MPTDKNIKTPELLMEYFRRYEADCKSNPRKENFYSSKLEKEVSVSREKPLTWDGFEIWLNDNKIINKLDDYKSNLDDRYSEYKYIIRAIHRLIYEDKYTGAVAGIYQHNIIARDLGLADNSAVKHSGEVKTTDKTVNITIGDKEIDLNVKK